MKYYDGVGQTTATTGTGSITVGAALGTNFFTLADYSVPNSTKIYYRLDDAGDTEIGEGTVSSSGTVVSRDRVLKSRIGGSAGTTKLTLSGAAQFRVVAPSEIVGLLTKLMEIAAKTSNYTFTALDAGVPIPFSHATAITGNLPAVANSDGEPYIARNDGAGDLTLDGNASEQIEGATTLVLKTGEAAFLYPNQAKTAWRAFKWPKLSFATDTETALGLRLRVDADMSLTDAQKRQAHENLGSVYRCGIAYLESGSIKLKPLHGNLLTDGGGNTYKISDTPITIAATGLTPSNLYYIFASDSNADGVLDLLEASGSAPTLAANGVPHATGNTTKILVAAGYVTTGPAFLDTATKRHVRSWLNDPGVYGNANTSTTRSVTSTSFVSVHTELQIEVVLWANEQYEYETTGSVWGNTAGAYVYVGVSIDGTATSATWPSGGTISRIPANNEYSHAHVKGRSTQASTALRTLYVLGKVSAGTGNWDANLFAFGARTFGNRVL